MFTKWISRFVSKKQQHVAPLGRIKGTVKWYDNRYGYGFIKTDSGPDVFLHNSEVLEEKLVRDENGKLQKVLRPRTVAEGERLEFQVEDGPRGPQARNVVAV
jgi:CspA family cold shock protein